jgi:hypothetical protein
MRCSLGLSVSVASYRRGRRWAMGGRSPEACLARRYSSCFCFVEAVDRSGKSVKPLLPLRPATSKQCPPAVCLERSLRSARSGPWGTGCGSCYSLRLQHSSVVRPSGFPVGMESIRPLGMRTFSVLTVTQVVDETTSEPASSALGCVDDLLSIRRAKAHGNSEFLAKLPSLGAGASTGPR